MRDGRGAQREFVHSSAPERLIPKERANDRGLTRAQGCCSRACTTVMNDRSDMGKQAIVGSTVEQVNAGGECLLVESSPSGGKQSSLPSARQSLDDQGGSLRNVQARHATETYVDGRGA